MAATCNYCNQEMVTGAGCTHTHTVTIGHEITADALPRVPYANPHQKPDGHCHDCGVLLGQLHHPGCDMERCPWCGEQAISCGHKWEGEAPDPDDDEETQWDNY